MTALRQFIAAVSHKALVSFELLEQHRVVKEVVGPKFDKDTHLEARMTQGPDDPTLRARATKVQKGLRGHHKDRRNRVEPAVDRPELECAVPDSVRWRRAGRLGVTVKHVLRDVAKKG